LFEAIHACLTEDGGEDLLNFLQDERQSFFGVGQLGLHGVEGDHFSEDAGGFGDGQGHVELEKILFTRQAGMHAVAEFVSQG
jgi:hypothetical protein